MFDGWKRLCLLSFPLNSSLMCCFSLNPLWTLASYSSVTSLLWIMDSGEIPLTQEMKWPWQGGSRGFYSAVQHKSATKLQFHTWPPAVLGCSAGKSASLSAMWIFLLCSLYAYINDELLYSHLKRMSIKERKERAVSQHRMVQFLFSSISHNPNINPLFASGQLRQLRHNR